MANTNEESVGASISDLKDQILNSIRSELDNASHISVCLSKLMCQITEKIQLRELLINELHELPNCNVSDKAMVFLTLFRDQDISRYRSICGILQVVNLNLQKTSAFEEILKRL
ncbi:hypothetical protein Tco_0452882 [Tanacetum coccineum]